MLLRWRGLDCVRKAGVLCQNAMEAMVARAKPGVKEYELRAAAGAAILEGGGDADCAVRFSVGEAYLVVADHEEHGWVPRACELRTAAEMTRDLALLRGQRSIGFAKSLVYGQVLLARSRPAAAAPRPGIEIQLVGPRTRRTAVTDADGRFSFFDLPSDVFTVRAKLPGETVSQELDQRRRRCGYATFLQ
ncbi:MAG: hypothetical protein NTV52_34125 [Acidobacteria bacterium]|nr:hypothetical protein [Acidobacteriota bacterium]